MFSPYTEAPPTYVVISASMSNSIGTSEVDAYRQGVELTQDKFFYIGSMVKIHAGEPNHQLPQRAFGELQHEIFQGVNTFVEIDNINPTNFVKATAAASHPSLTFPIITQASHQVPNDTYDGVIEPLAVRKIVPFPSNSIEMPFEIHSIRGDLESGNYNLFINSDRVISMGKFGGLTSGSDTFKDNIDKVNGLPANMLVLQNNSRKNSPYTDDQLKSGVIIDTPMSGQIASATLSMSPATDNYVSTGYLSFPKGFNWLNTSGLGSDSLAFGDLSYKKTPSWTPQANTSLRLWLSSISVVQNSNSVTISNDLSLYGNNAIASGSASPTWAAGPPTTITYNGTTNYMICDNLLITGSLTFGILFKMNAATINAGNFWILATLRMGVQLFFDIHLSSATGNPTYNRYTWLAKNTNDAGVATLGFTPPAGYDLNYHTVIVTYNNGPRSSASSYSCFFDGNSQAITAVSGLDRIITDNSGALGYYVGPARPNVDHFNGVIKDVVMFDGVLSTRELSSFNAWLNSPERLTH